MRQSEFSANVALAATKPSTQHAPIRKLTKRSFIARLFGLGSR